MKIKITKPVISGGKILAKDSIHDVDRKTAQLLIEGEFAIEHKEAPPAPPEGEKPPAN